MTKKLLRVCACGCGNPLVRGQIRRNLVRRECYTRHVQSIKKDPRLAPFHFDCLFCGAVGVPGLFSRSSYCDNDLTGRDCNVQPHKQKVRKWGEEARKREQAERGESSRSPLSGGKKRPDTGQPCHCCRFYGSGQGCPPDVVPCSDRAELGLPWRHEETGGAPCWEPRTVYPTGGRSAVGRLNLSNGPGGRLPD